MFGFFRLVLILFVGLTLVYLAVSLYSREVRAPNSAVAGNRRG